MGYLGNNFYFHGEHLLYHASLCLRKGGIPAFNVYEAYLSISPKDRKVADVFSPWHMKRRLH